MEENLNICVTTKACSFGKTIVEKIEVCLIDNLFRNIFIFLQNGTTKYTDHIGKCIHRSNDTNMCNFMVDFIRKLKTGMYMRDMMNVVLEHLGVLQVNPSNFKIDSMRKFSFLLDNRIERYR